MRPAIWLTLSQAASSAGNVTLTLLIAQRSSIEGFSWFALAFALYLGTQRFVRVLILIPRQIAVSQKTRVGASPVRPALLLAVLASLLLIAPGLALEREFGFWFLLVAGFAPALIGFDVYRNEFISQRRFRAAAMLDLSWLTVQVVASVSLFAGRVEAVGLFYLAWAIPPALLALVSRRVIGGGDGSGPGALRQLLESRPVLRDALSDLGSSVVLQQVLPLMLAGIVSLSVVGGMRASFAFLGPGTVLLMGVLPLLQLETAGRRDDLSAVRGIARRFTLGTMCLLGGYALLVAFIPESAGRWALGDTWPVAEQMLPGLAVAMVARVPFMTSLTVMRSLGTRDLVARLMGVEAILQVVGAVGGGLVGGAGGVAWGVASASILAAVYAWRQVASRG